MSVCAYVATEFKLRWWPWLVKICIWISYDMLTVIANSNDPFVTRNFSLSRGMRCKNSCCRDGCVAPNCLSFCIAAIGAFQCLANLINVVSNQFSDSCVDMWYPSTTVVDVWFILLNCLSLDKKYNYDIHLFLVSWKNMAVDHNNYPSMDWFVEQRSSCWLFCAMWFKRWKSA